MLILLALSAVLAAPAVPVDRPSLPPGCHDETQVIGFSDNEQALALKRTVSCERAHAAHDVFEMVELIDVGKERLEASFANRAPRRLSRAGHLIFTSPRVLKDANSVYAHLHAKSGWDRLSRIGHFTRITHSFEDQMVRFDFGRLQGEVQSHDNLAELSVSQADVLSAHVLVRLSSGIDIVAATISAQTTRATVGVSYSHFGHAVAVLVKSHNTTQVYVKTIASDDSIGSIKMGSAHVIEATPDELEHDFLSSHPYAKKTWNHFIRSNM